MREAITAIALVAPLPVWASALQASAVHRWVDKHRVLQYGDTVPPEHVDVEKQIVNDSGAIVAATRGKTTPREIAEEIEEDSRQEKLERKSGNPRLDDSALFAIYHTADEITMHRERKIELFQPKALVTQRIFEKSRAYTDILLLLETHCEI